jgi:hypothetical protein
MIDAFYDNSPFLRIAWKGVQDGMVKGKTYTIDRPNINNFSARAVTAAVTGPTPIDVVALPETFTLDQHYEVDCVANDIEWAQAAWEGKLPPVLRAAAAGLARNPELALVNKAIIGAYQQIDKTADALYDMAALHDKFLANGVVSGRKVLCLPSILHFTSNANLLSANIGKGGMAGFGMSTIFGDIEYAHQLSGVGYTDGTSDSLYQCNAAYEPGTRQIVLDTEGTGTMKAGDIVTFAGHTGNYLVTTGTTAHSQTLAIYPGLRAAVAENEVIALTATTATSLGVGVHEMGLGIAFGKEEIDPELASRLIMFESVTDPLTGLTLNYEVYREWKRTRRTLSVVYGVGSVLPDGVVKYKIS